MDILQVSHVAFAFACEWVGAMNDFNQAELIGHGSDTNMSQKRELDAHPSPRLYADRMMIGTYTSVYIFYI